MHIVESTISVGTKFHWTAYIASFAKYICQNVF